MKKCVFIAELDCLVQGSKSPLLLLRERGALPGEWVDQYLNLLKTNHLLWDNMDSWPKSLCYNFYRVGFHFQNAYDSWKEQHNEGNQETEKSLYKVRRHTEAFFLGLPCKDNEQDKCRNVTLLFRK